MSDAMPLETKKEKVDQALRTFGTVFLEDILPALEKIVAPLVLAYFQRNGLLGSTPDSQK